MECYPALANWTDLSALPPRPSAAPRESQAPITLPPCASIGHLGPAHDSFRKHNLEGAWKATLQALQVRPFHPEAYLLLAEIAAAARDSGSARTCAQQACSLAPGWRAPQPFLKTSPKGSAKPEWLVLPEGMPRASTSPRLSVCLITRNEEAFLGQCLQSVRDIAAQIVLVDTGSTDRTVEIARQYNAEVYHFPWCDDFSAARNAALEHAHGDWILTLDADEELSAEGRAQLPQHLSSAKIIAYRLPILDVGREEDGVNYVPRLFRNAPGLFYVGRIHEQVFGSVEARRREWGLENRLGTAALKHHGYKPEHVQSRDKVRRNLRLLEMALAELPGEPNLLMNLGLELVRSGNRDLGLQKYREAFNVLAAKPAGEVVPELRETLLTQFGTHLLAAKLFAQIEQVLESPLAARPELTASLHFLLGLAKMELQKFEEAASHMRHCLAKRQRPALSPIHKQIQSGAPHHCLALCLARLKDPEAADTEFRLAIAESSQSRQMRLDYARFLATEDHLVEALQVCYRLVTEDGQDARAWQAGGQMALSLPALLEFAGDWTSEASKNCPDDSTLRAQRAEALLLSEDVVQASEHWQSVEPANEPRRLAALAICALWLDRPLEVPAHAELAVSREFLAWYRRLLHFGAANLVERLNNRNPILQLALPSAAQILEQAFLEAKAEAAI